MLQRARTLSSTEVIIGLPGLLTVAIVACCAGFAAAFTAQQPIAWLVIWLGAACTTCVPRASGRVFERGEGRVNRE